MSQVDLSILIPSRNEIFLSQTIQDILKNIRGNTEVIAVLDGQWADPPIEDSPRVTLVYHSESIGQRAATNEAARLSKAKYVMKVDAHCAFDDGFDVKMMAEMRDDWTMVPIMRNLHAFDWVCPNGHRRYQSPSGPCKECGEPTTMDVVWIAKPNPASKAYCFDPEPHFQYFRQFNKRPEGKGNITETMSLQGSCFMMTREKYWELDICDETFGSWGSQGIEVAVKTWLSGGRVVCNQKTWYAHMFRTQGGDFGFPYHLSQSQVDHAKSTARDLFFNNKWPKQVRPLSWLVKKFWPVPGWTDADLARISPKMDKGIIYYTDNRLDDKVANAVREQIKSVGLPVVSASLKPIDFGKNIALGLERGPLTMFKQILAALESSEAEIIFFCEHDVIYHPSHFEFMPPRKDVFYYNLNVWKTRLEDGHSVRVKFCQQQSGLCAYRSLLLEHYRNRIAKIEHEHITQFRDLGFEPGTSKRASRVDNYTAESWESPFPNIDIRHDKNLTQSRWSPDEFRNKRYADGWTEADEIPGWGKTKDIVDGIKQGALWGVLHK